jgi:hypothetical protein
MAWRELKRARVFIRMVFIGLFMEGSEFLLEVNK